MSKKEISQNFYKGHLAPSGIISPAFPIPNIPAKIDFTIQELCASIARCGNTSCANTTILAAQAKAAEEFVNLFVCQSSSKFVIIDEAKTLIEAKLTSLAHDLGAGLANLYLEGMGYSWRATGSEVLPGKKKKPDYIYDNGTSEHEVVAMESKGSVAKRGTKNGIMKRAGEGYTKQLEPWLGKEIDTPNKPRIAHGYAFGTWAPFGKNIAEIGVHETQWPPRSSIKKDHISEEIVHVDRGIALANYEAVFNLVGSSLLASELQSLRTKKEMWSDESRTEEFLEVEVLGQPYLVSLPRYRFLLRRPWLPYDLLELPDIHSYLYSSTFAVNLDIAKTITETMHNLELTRIKISPVNNGLIMDARGSEKVALFKDGLALLAPGYIQPDSEGRVFQRTHKGELRAISHF